MKRNRKLAASVVVTVGVIAGCHPTTAERPEPPRHLPTATTTPTTEIPDTKPDPEPEPEPRLPNMPVGEGQLIREDNFCYWLPAEPDAEQYEINCPTDFPNLPDAPPGVHVNTRDDGTCFYVKSFSDDCAKPSRCNPPGPIDITVRCRPNE